MNFLGDSTSDDTEGSEISELLGEEEDADGSGDLPSPTNEPLEHTMSNQIPLQRIAMSVRHKKHRGSKILKAGWMVHFTNSSADKKVYFVFFYFCALSVLKQFHGIATSKNIFIFRKKYTTGV